MHEKEAVLYEPASKETGLVECHLCSHRCKIKPGNRGICGVREHREGRLFSLVYGNVVSEHIDPIEKKPLFHVLPGSSSYSIATVGCNFHCRHCQNFEISQYPQRHRGEIIGVSRSPGQIVAAACKHGCRTISYTYVEPTIFFEFAFDTAVLAREAGIRNVFVSNGYTTPEATRKIAPYLDANNIDLKAFTEKFYREVCGAKLQPVLDTIALMKELGVWVEVTTLIIPDLNDSEQELRDIANFIGNIDPSIPWHVTRFHPTYKMVDRPATPIATLRRAREIGLEAGLKYVYQGNVPGEDGENTFCPHCRQLLIERRGFQIYRNRLSNGSCPDCGTAVAGIFK